MNGVEQPLQINLRRGPGPSEGLEVLSRTRPLPSCPTPEANPGHSPSALPPGLSHWRCLWVTRQTRSHLSGLGVIAQPLPTCPQGPVSTPTPSPAPQELWLTWKREGPRAWGLCQSLAVSWGCCEATLARAQASGRGQRLERTIAAQV